MKTEIGFTRTGQKLEKLIVEHSFNADTSAGKGEIQRALLAEGIGQSMIRFQRPYSATHDQIESLARLFSPVRA